jgi:hypothetical protein
VEPEGSLPCSQETSNGPYPEPEQSSPYNLIYISKIHLLLYSHLRLGLVLPSGLFPSGEHHVHFQNAFFAILKCSLSLMLLIASASTLFLIAVCICSCRLCDVWSLMRATCPYGLTWLVALKEWRALNTSWHDSQSTAGASCILHLQNFYFVHFWWCEGRAEHTVDPLLGNDSINTFPRRQILGKQPVAG